MAGNKVHVLHHGHLVVPRGGLIDPDPRLEQDPSASPLCDAPCLTYLVETADGKTIMFDAAVSNMHLQEWPEEYQGFVYHRTEEQIFENLLRAHGYGPEDIDYLLLSHLHCDHAGNARLFNAANTTILTHENEYKSACQHEAFGAFYVRADYDLPARRFTLLSKEEQLADGVTAIELPGHTAGTMGLVVETERSGTLILTSDACYLKDSYELERSEAAPADKELWIRSMQTLKARARRQNATIIFGHDHGCRHEGDCVLRDEEEIRLARPYL